MKRIRGLIVAALAVAAVASVPASASASAGVSAGEFKGSQAGSLEIGVNGGSTFSCSEISFEASLKEPSFTATTSSLTNGKCGGVGLTMNGCQLVLHPGGAQSVGVGGGESCGRIKLWYGACGLIEIPVQSGIAATYENQAGGGFKVAINDTNVEYFFSNCSPKEAHHDLRIVGTFNVTGGSVTTGGLSVGGGSEGQFEAVEYPVTVTGERLPSVGKAVVLKAVNLSCGTAAYSGPELTKAASSLTLNVTYSGCTWMLGSATVSMNSCRYEYSGLKKFVNEGEYSATAKIACNEGDAIKATGGGCTVTIPAQTLGGGEVGFATQDYNSVAGLFGVMNASGFTYTSSNAFACKLMGIPNGTYTNGASEAGMLLRGTF